MRELEFVIKKNEQIAKDIYKMSIFSSIGAGKIRCGQFLNISINRPDMLLKRPFGILAYDKEGKNIKFCYQVVGKGTEYLSKMLKNEKVFVTIPLGRGFEIQDTQKTVVLVGGGVGIFPLLSVLQEYSDKKYHSFLGFRSKCSACMLEEFEKNTKLYLATDDGTLGDKNNIVSLFFDNYHRINPDIILSCGPTVMLSALKEGLIERNITIPTLVSLEERMGCGIGACLVCACAIKTANGKQNKRVCKDGPVFDIMEVEL